MSKKRVAKSKSPYKKKKPTTQTVKKTKSLSGLYRNKIKHSSEWDGTLRTYKAEYIIKKFNPKNAKDMARIIAVTRAKKVETIYDEEYSMFYEIDDLVSLVKRSKKSDWWNYYITKIDMVDICADVWKLSPTLNKKYPNTVIKEGFPPFAKAGDIRAGWHDFLAETRKELALKYPNVKKH